MRILMVAPAFPSPRALGRAPYLAALARDLAGRGHDIRVVAPATRSRDPVEERRAGCLVRRFRFLTSGTILKRGGSGPVRLATYVLSGVHIVRDEITAFRPDVIYAHWVIPGGLLAQLARPAAPLVLHAHGTDLRVLGRSRTYGPWVRRVLRGASGCLAASEELRDLARSLGATGPVDLAPIGADTGVFRPGDPAEARRRLGLDPAVPLVLFVGDLLRPKGARRLYDAWRPFRRTAQVAFVGDGPERAVIRALARQDEIGGSVHLPGALGPAEVATWMQAATLVALPSLSEGTPVSLAEAMATGVPVVASDVGGVRALVGDGGLVLPPRDLDRWREALRALLFEPERRAALARAALARRVAISLARTVDAVETFLAAARPPPRPARAEPGPGHGAAATPAAHDAFWRQADPVRRDARSLERAEVAFRLLGRPGGGRLLDAGCGRGVAAAYFRERGFAVDAIDISGEAVLEARRRGVEARCADLACVLAGSPSAYDIVLALEVLEHVPDPRAALGAMAAALRPGGVLCASLPNDRHLGARLAALLGLGSSNPLHLRPFDPREAERFLTSSGLRVIRRAYIPLPPPGGLAGSLPLMRALGAALARILPSVFAIGAMFCLAPGGRGEADA